MACAVPVEGVLCRQRYTAIVDSGRIGSTEKNSRKRAKRTYAQTSIDQTTLIRRRSTLFIHMSIFIVYQSHGSAHALSICIKRRYAIASVNKHRIALQKLGARNLHRKDVSDAKIVCEMLAVSVHHHLVGFERFNMRVNGLDTPITFQTVTTLPIYRSVPA